MDPLGKLGPKPLGAIESPAAVEVEKVAIEDHFVGGVGPVFGERAPKGLSDLEILEAIKAGQIDGPTGMKRIAYQGGWPIETPEGHWFAALDDGRGPFRLAGDHNGWAATPMEQHGGISLSFVPKPAGRYKLVDRDGNFFADPWARRYDYDGNGEISLASARGAHLERWPLMETKGLKPRTVRVWVPANKPTHHLYVHDGQNLFDPGAPHGGWRLQHAVGPSTLVIGIDSTPNEKDRREELTHTPEWKGGKWVGGKGHFYADFARKDLQPFIEAYYGKPRKVGVMGASLGGSMAYYQAERFPNAYDFVSSLSGTFGWGALTEHSNGDTLERRYAAMAAEGRRMRRPIFYLDSGGEPGGKDNYDSNRKMANALAGQGYEWNKSLWHWHEPGAPHTERSWADRVHRPLSIFEKL